MPAYQVIWMHRDGTEEESGDLRHNPVGSFLPYAQPVWDWLVARRLTLLATTGAIAWPDADQPPIVIAAEWVQLSRAL